MDRKIEYGTDSGAPNPAGGLCGTEPIDGPSWADSTYPASGAYSPSTPHENAPTDTPDAPSQAGVSRRIVSRRGLVMPPPATPTVEELPPLKTGRVPTTVGVPWDGNSPVPVPEHGLRSPSNPFPVPEHDLRGEPLPVTRNPAPWQSSVIFLETRVDIMRREFECQMTIFPRTAFSCTHRRLVDFDEMVRSNRAPVAHSRIPERILREMLRECISHLEASILIPGLERELERISIDGGMFRGV